MSEKILCARNITKRFGGLVAVNDVTVEIEKGTIHALIGPNGSGKSTFLNLISGLYTLNAGEITLAGNRLHRLPPYKIAQAGVGRTFQNIRLFRHLTVLQNVMVGLHFRYNAGFLPTLLRLPRAREMERRFRELAEEALHFVGLEEFANWMAVNLSYGQQRLVEIARALVMEPKLLLLDEPDAGLNPSESIVLMERIRSINQRGISILLVEHNMRLVMDISDRISVLDFGNKIAEGTPEEIQENERVIEAYLGRSENQEPVDESVGEQ